MDWPGRYINVRYCGGLLVYDASATERPLGTAPVAEKPFVQKRVFVPERALVSLINGIDKGSMNSSADGIEYSSTICADYINTRYHNYHLYCIFIHWRVPTHR